MICDRYYYSILTPTEKAMYNKIYTAMQNHEPTVTIKNFDGTDVGKLMTAINLDNPHLFYVDFDYRFQSDAFDLTIILNYIYNKSDTAVLTEKVKKVCNKILSKVTGKTEFAKELSLHDILVRNVLYDNVAKKDILKFHARSNTILGVLFCKKAVCEGIAKTFKFLLNALNIKCVVVKGKAIDDLAGRVDSDIFHAWNIVKIDGNPYHVDLTWDINLSINNIVRHEYFNLTDSDIRFDHVIEKRYPSCKVKGNNYFYKKGLVVASKEELRSIISDKIKNGENAVEFKVSGDPIRKGVDMLNIVKTCLESVVGDERNYSLCGANPSEQGVCYFEWKLM